MRLQQLHIEQQERLRHETLEEREARHARDRQNHMQLQTPELPLFQQPHVRTKMIQFHSRLATLLMPQCITCLARFPAMSVRTLPTSGETECLRCSRDKHIPKLYSSANNMNPGSVPPEVVVSCFENF